MYSIKITSRFKKNYKLMVRQGKDVTILDNVIEMLRKGITLDEKYKDHQLTGNFALFRECHIKSDWLLIYMIENDILTLTLIDTGSHSDLFHM